MNFQNVKEIEQFKIVNIYFIHIHERNMGTKTLKCQERSQKQNMGLGKHKIAQKLN